MRFQQLLPLATLAAASPCPFGELAERGLLSAEDTDKFLDARANGEAAVERQMKQKREVEYAQQAQYYKRQLEERDLPLGGGLLNGVIQPFTGVLSGLEVPTLVAII